MVARSPAALVLGLLLPAVVLVGAWVLLDRAPEVHGHAQTFERRLAETPPRVVVLGSSLANRGVDLDVLARELGVRRDEVVLLQLPHASAAHWYAILKNRVFGGGYEPDLVLIAGALTTMLNHDLLQYQGNVERLVEQLSADEPVLARKVFGFDQTADFRGYFARERASRWRDALLVGARDQFLTWAFTRSARIEEGERLAEKVNETVFANERMDYGLHREDATGVGVDLTDPSWVDHAVGEGFSLREHALLDDIQDLAAEHGASVAWVRMPFPPSNPRMDEVPPEIEAEALTWMEELGSGYLDLRALDLTDADFEDMRHLTPEGAERFTTSLGRMLRTMGALEGERLPVIRPVGGVGTPRWSESPPALPEPVREEGCGWRTAPWEGLAGVGARLAALPTGVLPPVEVLADERSLPMGDAADCDGTWRLAADGSLQVAAPDASSSVSVRWAGPVTQPAIGGPAAWLPPGATLEVPVSTAWGLPARSFVVLARGLALGEVPEIVLEVEGEEVALDVDDGRVFGGARPPVPDGPWTVHLRASSRGTPVLVHHLGLGAPPATTAVLGRAETLHGASLRVVGGRLDDTRAHARYAAPPAPEAFAPQLARGPRQVASVALPTFFDLADASRKDSARPNDCSPVRVLEDGEPLPRHHEVCYDVLTKGQGRVCHAGPTVYLTASDDTDPLANGRRYTLALDPSRACATWTQRGAATLRGSWWLYPGDEATLDVPSKRLEIFRDGANVLALEVAPHVAEAEEPLTIRVEADGRTVLETRWRPPAGDRQQHVVRLPLDVPLPPRPRQVRIVVANPDARAFHLLTMVALEEAWGETVAPPVAQQERDAAEPIAGVAAERTGSTPALPAPRRIGPTDHDAIEARLFALWPVSTSALEKRGLPPLSPLRLATSEGVLSPVRSQRTFRQGCEACFLHLGQAVYHRAEGAIVPVLTEAFPLEDGEQRAWWLGPGHTGHWTVPLDRPAQAHVEVVATAFTATRADAPPEVGVTLDGGEPVPLVPRGAEGQLRAVVQVPKRDAPWEVAVRVEDPRAIVLVQEITLIDGETRRLVAASR